MTITDLQGCIDDYWEKNKVFHGAFGSHIHKYLDSLHLMGIFSFDICTFEEDCRRYSWHDEDKALSESIRSKFGEGVEDLVRELASTPNIG